MEFYVCICTICARLSVLLSCFRIGNLFFQLMLCIWQVHMKPFLKSLLNHNFLLSEYFVDLMWAKNLVSAEALNSFPASVKGERNPVVIQWHTKV